MEAKNYPFYAVQFHPEKNNFEWKVFAKRSKEAIEVVQIMSNKFVEKARQNTNNMPMLRSRSSGMSKKKLIVAVATPVNAMIPPVINHFF